MFDHSDHDVPNVKLLAIVELMSRKVTLTFIFSSDVIDDDVVPAMIGLLRYDCVVSAMKAPASQLDAVGLAP